MKVQQFSPSSKSSQAQATARASRSTGAAERKSIDFADALAGARKEPAEPKPQETEARPAKKPAAAAARKKHAGRNEAEAPQDETVAAHDVVADDVQSLPTSEQEQVSADSEGTVATDEGDADADADADSDGAIIKVDADLSAITAAPNMGPPAPIADRVDGGEGSHPNPVPICPMPRPQGGMVPTKGANAADEVADVSQDAAATILEGIEDLIGESIAPDDLDLGRAVARTPDTATMAAASSFADQPADVEESLTSDPTGSAEQPLPTISSPLALADDVNLDDELSSSPAPASADATTPLTPTPIQPQVPKTQVASTPPATPVPTPPQAQFAELNHAKIVTAVRGELLPHGGSMQLRLDPPELGALQVLVHMTDGVMTASFHTSSDDATRLLSHSLSQLKAVLESQGVSVDKLQVQQSTRDQQAQNDDPRQQQRDPQDDAHRQEQQRKEMLRRMWRKLAIGSDPLDLVA